MSIVVWVFHFLVEILIVLHVTVNIIPKKQLFVIEPIICSYTIKIHFPPSFDYNKTKSVVSFWSISIKQNVIKIGLLIN